MKENRGITILIAASLIVAVAIIASGQVARAINGVGGVLWIASTVLLIRHLRGTQQFARLLTIASSITLVLVLVTKPSHYLSAIIGFSIGGAVVAYAARSQELAWSAMVPALWLPVHLGVAVVRAIERSVRDLPTTVRTEPPPTAAFVPFAMVLAALLGGFAVQMWRQRHVSTPVVRRHRPSKA